VKDSAVFVKSPLVSVVVSSYSDDRFHDIHRLLSSLESQYYRNFEIIVVIEKSRELYRRIKLRLKNRNYLNNRIIFNHGNQGLSAARNLGLKFAVGDIIAFIDDDALASPGWLQEMVKTYCDFPDAIGVTGPVTPLWENTSMAWFPLELYWIFACTDGNEKEKKSIRNGYGTNMSFKKETFERCGNFLERLGAKGSGENGKKELVGEETEFSLRARRQTGGRIIFSPGVLVQHRVLRYRFTSKFIARRSYWEGYSKVIFRKLYCRFNKDTLSKEYVLLQRILFKLIPKTLPGLVLNPRTSWKRLVVTLMVLFCVSFGYLRGSLYHVEEQEALT
jgi:glycosyltransferase involved in cell wall biosynthesis